MNYENMVLNNSFTAGEDLRLAQYRAVKLSRGKVVKASTGEHGIGILQNAPNTDEQANVCMFGICPVVCGGSIAEGAFVCSDASGDMLTISSTYYILGYLLEAGEDTEIHPMFVYPGFKNS